ncbi:MAG: glycosyltransferase family 2 protein [Enterocloster clostridioformis]
MTKKSVFDQVGGLSPELAVAFNDIDHRMKVRASGETGSVCALFMLYHYESKSEEALRIRLQR